MKFVPQRVTRNIGKKVLLAKKHSPHIFFAGGLGAVVTGAVLACRATLKLEENIDIIKQEVDSIKNINYKNGQEYTEKEYTKDLSYVYTKSAIRLGKLYGPAIVVGGAGIAALTGSHVQLTHRNTALTVTLAGVTKAYDQYRARVQAELGEERELEIHRAIELKDAEINGKKTAVKVTDPNGWSMYARMFDETCPNWQKDSELNRIFIQCQQNHANHVLHARGHIFLNEVYDALGMERSRAGAVVGWVTDGDGDGYVDFGLFEATNSRFINNMERSMILDFNVDGVIFDKI